MRPHYSLVHSEAALCSQLPGAPRGELSWQGAGGWPSIRAQCLAGRHKWWAARHSPEREEAKDYCVLTPHPVLSPQVCRNHVLTAATNPSFSNRLLASEKYCRWYMCMHWFHNLPFHSEWWKKKDPPSPTSCCVVLHGLFDLSEPSFLIKTLEVIILY
jgi:hypothetical protein